MNRTMQSSTEKSIGDSLHSSKHKQNNFMRLRQTSAEELNIEHNNSYFESIKNRVNDKKRDF